MKAELVAVGPAGTNFSFLSKIDLSAKENLKAKAPKKLLPSTPGCCHVEHDPTSGTMHYCSFPTSKGKQSNGFLCDAHQARLFPSYKLTSEELSRVNYRGTFEDQILLKDRRQIARDLEVGVAIRPKYGKFVKVQTEDEMMDEMLTEFFEHDFMDDSF